MLTEVIVSPHWTQMTMGALGLGRCLQAFSPHLAHVSEPVPPSKPPWGWATDMNTQHWYWAPILVQHSQHQMLGCHIWGIWHYPWETYGITLGWHIPSSVGPPFGFSLRENSERGIHGNILPPLLVDWEERWGARIKGKENLGKKKVDRTGANWLPILVLGTCLTQASIR